MSDISSAPAGSDAAPAFDLPADAPQEFSSVNDALSYLTSLDEKRNTAESADPATAEPELSKDSSDPATDPAEVTDEAEPAELPPIEPPRSWTKEEKEEFQTYPREAQEKIARREQERETNFRRSQNEIAEQRKATEAERGKAEQARQQYEAKLPAVMQTLLNQNNEQFSDINSMADVESLAREAQRLWPIDPFAAGELSAKLNAWQVHQQKMANTRSELDQAEGRKAQEHSTEWAMHVQKENTLAAEFIPELADKVRGPALTQRVATELLPELGFKDSELADLANGKTKLSIYDHRIQRLLADGLKLRDIQGATKAVAAKPIPPVQRPGTTRATSDASEREQALNRKPELTQKEALELLGLQSGRQRRRAS